MDMRKQQAAAERQFAGQPAASENRVDVAQIDLGTMETGDAPEVARDERRRERRTCELEPDRAVEIAEGAGGEWLGRPGCRVAGCLARCLGREAQHGR